MSGALQRQDWGLEGFPLLRLHLLLHWSPGRGGESLPLSCLIREKRFSLTVITGLENVPSSLRGEDISKEKHWLFHPEVSCSSRKRITFMFVEAAFCLE